MENLRKIQEINIIENELTSLKREKEIIDCQYNRRKSELLELSKMATTGERHTELIRQMVDLSSQWRQECFRLNYKINVRTEALNSKKRSLQ